MIGSIRSWTVEHLMYTCRMRCDQRRCRYSHIDTTASHRSLLAHGCRIAIAMLLFLGRFKFVNLVAQCRSRNAIDDRCASGAQLTAANILDGHFEIRLTICTFNRRATIGSGGDRSAKEILKVCRKSVQLTIDKHQSHLDRISSAFGSDLTVVHRR